MGSAGIPQFGKPWIETPLLEASALSRAAGCRIFVKLENLQPSASFKSRGIGNLILQAVIRHHQQSDASSKQLHFYSSSGGNAGLACVTAASSLGYPASVVVPMSTKPMMIGKIQVAGASEVLQHGVSWQEADEYLRNTVMPKAASKGQECIYVPPFDHEDIWEGAGSMVEEIYHQLNGEIPDAIVCSVGGGGLFCGIMKGLDRVSWHHDVKVLAIETIGADSLHQSVQAGQLITLPAITSIASSLGARRVAEQAFKYAQQPNVTSAVLDDAHACMACWRLADDQRILVEPACGASIAVCYDGRLKCLLPGLKPESKVVVILCGGSGVTLDLISQWKEKYGDEIGQQTMDGMVPSSFTTYA